jgi:hypothetical protein
LAILLISAPLAGWFLLKRSNSEDLKWSSFFVIFFYSVSFGNVFSISAVHSMEVDRYSSVLFIEALFAQAWAMRWLVEIAVRKLPSSKCELSTPFVPMQAKLHRNGSERSARTECGEILGNHLSMAFDCFPARLRARERESRNLAELNSVSLC